MNHKWLIQPWEASNSLLRRELVQKCRRVYVQNASNKSFQFGSVSFCLVLTSILFKSGKAKRGFSLAQNSNRGRGNTYYDKSSCLDKTCTCTRITVTHGREQWLSHVAKQLIQQCIFPLLWVWSQEMEIIDYKLNESDISLHNCCYWRGHCVCSNMYLSGGQVDVSSCLD